MFEYNCPDCGATNNLHKIGCDFEHTDWYEIEKAYTDILAVVIGEASEESAVTKEALKSGVPGQWGYLHGAVYEQLVFYHRIEETEYDTIVPVDAEERNERFVPTRDPVKTLWEKGSVPGCHDNTVFALISWHESKGFTWQDTRTRLLDWFERTGTWDRGGFAEESPEQILDQKKHVYETGYGWFDKARAAKGVIENNH